MNSGAWLLKELVVRPVLKWIVSECRGCDSGRSVNNGFIRVMTSNNRAALLSETALESANVILRVLRVVQKALV